MAAPLPPPDPHESPFGESDLEVSAPTTLFARGTPSPEAERLADAIVSARPGLLIVVTPD